MVCLAVPAPYAGPAGLRYIARPFRRVRVHGWRRRPSEQAPVDLDHVGGSGVVGHREQRGLGGNRAPAECLGAEFGPVRPGGMLARPRLPRVVVVVGARAYGHWGPPPDRVPHDPPYRDGAL